MIKNVISIYVHGVITAVDPLLHAMFILSSELGHDGKTKKRKKVCAKSFTEGWIEFESKKVAKYVASSLNNTQISTRKKSKFYDVIWNIKYLPR